MLMLNMAMNIHVTKILQLKKEFPNYSKGSNLKSKQKMMLPIVYILTTICAFLSLILAE